MDERELKILKVHEFIKGRRVKIISTDATQNAGWFGSHHIDKEGLIGFVYEVHQNVFEAVKVEVDVDGQPSRSYWYHKDLELIDPPDIGPKEPPAFFDLNNLFAG